MDLISSLYRNSFRFPSLFLSHPYDSSSTLENWCREFAKFAPSINVQTYYGLKNDRSGLRQELLESMKSKKKDDGWEVLITTYNLAQANDDRKFFRKIEWNVSCFPPL
jgi:SWI/SNF-related matrix-associated actin-dependent regulator of chromatin subfamily A containing DEAD/H box 1